MDDGDDGSPEPNLTLEDDGVVVLAQPVTNPSTPVSNTPAVIVDVENQKVVGNPADALAP